MVKNPPENMPRITPYIYYEDVASALDWLSIVFGFCERMRMTGTDDQIVHAEMELADGVIMMGRPGPDYQNPKQHGHVSQHLYVYVDDVDRHYQRAESAGAMILAPPEDRFYGDRIYMTQDLEGHHWTFAQHVRDVALEDMKLPA